MESMIACILSNPKFPNMTIIILNIIILIILFFCIFYNISFLFVNKYEIAIPRLNAAIIGTVNKNKMVDNNHIITNFFSFEKCSASKNITI
jgi:hypothetical protein